MATLTLNASHFGNSFSGSRDISSVNAPSMADTLPSIDFGFNDLRERMAQFTSRFDEFIERGRKRVLEERNAFRMNVAEMEENQRNRKTAITELESKSTSHADILAKEVAETEEMEEAISSLTDQRDEHVARRDQLKADIATTHNSIRHKREAQATHQRAIEAQMRHNLPELRFWEQCLGMRIEKSGFEVQDQIKFVFTNAGEKRDGQEAWFELNMAGLEYYVSESNPELQKEDVEALITRLSGSRELGPFLKGMRRLLSNEMNA